MLTARPPTLRDPALALGSRNAPSSRRGAPGRTPSIRSLSPKRGSAGSTLPSPSRAKRRSFPTACSLTAWRTGWSISSAGAASPRRSRSSCAGISRGASPSRVPTRSARRARGSCSAHTSGRSAGSRRGREQRAALATLERLRPPGDWRRVLGRGGARSHAGRAGSSPGGGVAAARGLAESRGTAGGRTFRPAGDRRGAGGALHRLESAGRRRPVAAARRRASETVIATDQGVVADHRLVLPVSKPSANRRLAGTLSSAPRS